MNSPSIFSQKMSQGQNFRWKKLNGCRVWGQNVTRTFRSWTFYQDSHIFEVVLLMLLFFYVFRIFKYFARMYSSFLLGAACADCTDVFQVCYWYCYLLWWNIPDFLVLTFFVLLYSSFLRLICSVMMYSKFLIGVVVRSNAFQVFTDTLCISTASTVS
jgi:hypothetical protein